MWYTFSKGDEEGSGKVMAPYTIDITDEAEEDLQYYRAYERQQIVNNIQVQLVHEPGQETNSRKTLRQNPIASWELKIGKYRVFYEIDDEDRVVIIISIGHKDHNVLYIRGKVVKL
jgi:mRNA-degrading endonuclease RelE of RelBE toxin-antitoxin system